jgi:hypothetical protein
MADETLPNPPAPDSLPEGSDSAAPPISQDPIPSDVLRSAYNAFKKRWKLTNLDQVSQIGRGPMSSGQKSAITGITPPDQYPPKVWNELVKQGRLKYVGTGCYALP